MHFYLKYFLDDETGRKLRYGAITDPKWPNRPSDRQQNCVSFATITTNRLSKGEGLIFFLCCRRGPLVPIRRHRRRSHHRQPDDAVPDPAAHSRFAPLPHPSAPTGVALSDGEHQHQEDPLRHAAGPAPRQQRCVGPRVLDQVMCVFVLQGR